MKFLSDFNAKISSQINFEYNGQTFERYVRFDIPAIEVLSLLRKANREEVDMGSFQNMSEFKEKAFDNNDERVQFCGGTYEKLESGDPDFDFYNKAMQKIASDKVFKNIATKFENTTKRTRVRSSHDGEWDFDKRWDCEPFQRRETRKTGSKIVKLNVSLSFSARVGADTVNEYASFCAALTSMLEKNGVLVDLTVFRRGRNFLNGNSWSNFQGVESLYFITNKVKRADEYMAPSHLLKILSTNYMRRAAFSCVIMSAEHLKKDVSDTLGMPYEYGKTWEINGDEVYIYSCPSYSEQHNIVKSLTEMLGRI